MEKRPTCLIIATHVRYAGGVQEQYAPLGEVLAKVAKMNREARDTGWTFSIREAR